jgi:hypothetical protein
MAEFVSHLLGFWRPAELGHPVGLAIAGTRIYLTGGDTDRLLLYDVPADAP